MKVLCCFILLFRSYWADCWSNDLTNCGVCVDAYEYWKIASKGCYLLLELFPPIYKNLFVFSCSMWSMCRNDVALEVLGRNTENNVCATVGNYVEVVRLEEVESFTVAYETVFATMICAPRLAGPSEADVKIK